ncbi:hypothetical protein IWZ01DRAFT_482638 [Phyllosticta capitalensis]
MASLPSSPSTPPPPASPLPVNDPSPAEMAESEPIPLPQSASLLAGIMEAASASPESSSLPPADMAGSPSTLLPSPFPPSGGIAEAASASPESSTLPPSGTAKSPSPLLPSGFPPSGCMAEAASTAALSDEGEGGVSDSSTGSSKRKLSDSDVEDQADARPEGDFDRRVHFAGPAGYLDLNSKDLRAMIYFVRRRLPRDPVDRLPQAGEDLPPNLDAAKRMLKAILVFLAVEVRILTTVSHENGNDLLAMTAEERADIWKTHFDHDPLSLARNMWQPVAHVVDFGAMFAPPPDADEHTQNILGEWREYVYQCWVRNAEAAFVYWILRNEKPEAAADDVEEEKEDNPCECWVRMTDKGDVSVPDLADLPVIVTELGFPSKRRKMAVASGTELSPDLEGLDGGRVDLGDVEAESTTTD